MLRPPEAQVVAAFTRFVSEKGTTIGRVRIDDKDPSQEAVTIHLEDLQIVLVSLAQNGTNPDLLQALKSLVKHSFSTTTAYEILFVCTSSQQMIARSIIDRGVSVVPLHLGIARTLGLPLTWLSSQRELLQNSLAPVTVDGQRRLADLYAIQDSSGKTVAQELLRSLLARWERRSDRFTYIRAEAGKGKSTLFCNAAVEQLDRGDGPLPLFVPLRILQRGRGVSWSDLCAVVGILAESAANVAASVRAGLTTLILDGLDEVAGRYDQTIVRQVLDAIEPLTRSENSCVLVSGRTTESTLLDRSRTRLCGIELPSGTEPAFKVYAELVAGDITPKWPRLARRVPEPPIPAATLKDLDPTGKELSIIIEWLQLVFDELGKERSLFFVQSLACLGRSLQLDGNQPLVIHQQGGDIKLTRTSLFDVSILASALACIREQDKIEELARDIFTPARQIELLMLYSLLASAQTSAAGSLPTPNAAASNVFGVDPVNQNEEFTAILRQMQKHALLFATSGEGIRAGDWRPQFLSDWVRCALLCRAWLRREDWGTVPASLVAGFVARAERARISFESLFPELLSNEKLLDLDALVTALKNGIAEESPEASANFWALKAGLPSQGSIALPGEMTGLAPLADLSDLAFEGNDFDSTFAGTLAVMVGLEMMACTLSDCAFAQCDLTDAVFNGCTFSNVTLEFCDGPIVFDSCRFVNCRFRNGRGQALPIYQFSNCRFDRTCLIEQTQETSTGRFGPVARFDNSICEGMPRVLISGDFAGLTTISPEGLQIASKAGQEEAEIQCLRALLKPFFPRRAGSAGDFQARGYVRTSAIGRGLFPDGSPTTPNLISVLFAVGFSTGGRQAHIYAPWSSVGGGSADAVELRNELLAFLRTGGQGPRVRQMLERIREFL